MLNSRDKNTGTYLSGMRGRGAGGGGSDRYMKPGFELRKGGSCRSSAKIINGMGKIKVQLLSPFSFLSFLSCLPFFLFLNKQTLVCDLREDADLLPR